MRACNGRVLAVFFAVAILGCSSGTAGGDEEPGALSSEGRYSTASVRFAGANKCRAVGGLFTGVGRGGCAKRATLQYTFTPTPTQVGNTDGNIDVEIWVDDLRVGRERVPCHGMRYTVYASCP